MHSILLPKKSCIAERREQRTKQIVANIKTDPEKVKVLSNSKQKKPGHNNQTCMSKSRISSVTDIDEK